MNTPAQARQELAQLRHKVQVYYTVHTLLYAVALGLLIWKPARMVGLVLGVANMIFYFLWLRGQVKGYSTAVTEANLRLGLSAPLVNARLTGRNAIAPEDFDRWQLLPRREGKGNSLLTQNGVTGQLDGMNVSCTEVTLHYPYQTPQNKQSFSFLNGTLLWADAPAQGDWLLLHKGLLHEMSQRSFLTHCGYVPAQLPDSLAEAFECYAHTEDAALPEHLARRLEHISSDTKTLGAVRLCEKGSMFFFRNRFYTAAAKVRDLPEEKALASNLLPERDEVLSFFRWQQKAAQ